MKKSILIILLALSCTAAKAQLPSSVEISGNPIQFSKVLAVDSALTKDKLYSFGVEWFAKTFNNARYVLQMQDKDAGIIIGKGSFEYYLGGSNLKSIQYTVKLSF